MNQLGSDVEFEVLGKRLKASRLKLSITRQFVAWVKPQLGDPMLRLKSVVKDLPESVALEAYRDAKREAEEIEALDWNSTAVLRFRGTEQGVCHLLWLMLKVHHPGITEDQVNDIAGVIGDDKVLEIMAVANGQDPNAVREAVKKKLAEMREAAAPGSTGG